VENMSYFVCPDTGKHHFIFGPSHAGEVALAASAPLLVQLPIAPTVSALCDAGEIEKVNLQETPILLQAFVEAVPLRAMKET
jgi:NUBPL iron-transfer P-loop NTPase